MKDQSSYTPALKNANGSFSKEEALELIMNNVEDNFFLINKDLYVVATSEYTKLKVKEYFGIDLVEGMSILSLAPPDRHAGLIKLYKEVFKGLEQKSETEVHNGDEMIFFEHFFKPARDCKGKIVGAVITSRVITERKQAEKALKEIEERWRFALEGSNQGVWDWNMKTGEVFYSNSYKRLYGFDANEMSNRIEEWESMVHPEDRKKLEAAIKQHSAQSDPFYESNYRIRTKNGDYKWIMAKGMLVGKDADGNPLRMIGTHTDITTQIEAEEKIRLSEQEYRSLFESNPLPSYIYDATSLGFLEVNQAAVEFYGYSRKEFLKSTIYEIHHDDGYAKLKERNRAEKTTKSFAINNWQHKKKDGKPVFVDLRINAINYRGIDAKLVVAHDVTAKVLIEKELRESNERFSYAAKASSEALWEWDVETDEFYISQAYTELFGWKLNENRKFDEWHDYIHPDDREETIRDYYACVEDRTKERWSKGYRYRKADGTYAEVIDKAIILRDEKGAAIKVVGATQDVTAQKKTEEDLRISNDRYKHAIHATSDIVWDWDIKSNNILWSDNYTRVLGWKLPENNTLSFEKSFEHIHKADKKRIEKSIAKTVADPKQTSWKEEFRYQKADGKYAYLADRGYVIRNEDGRALQMIGALKDITEAKQNEELLSLERQIFEMSTDLEISFKKIVLTLLEGIEKIHGDAQTCVALLTKENTIELLAAPSLPVEFSNAVEGLKIGPEAGSCGSAMWTKEIVIVENIAKHPYWINYKTLAEKYHLKACWSLPIIHSSGKVMGCFAIYYNEVKHPSYEELRTFERVRNIVRILMEHSWSLTEIKAAKERFDIMMKATHDLIWDWNIETGIVYRDEAGLKQVFGVSSNESIQEIYQWLARVHPKDQKRVDAVIKKILKSTDQNTFEVEYRFLKDDGDYSHVYDRGMIIRNADNQAVRMIGAAQDVTERKRLEKELLQNELERQKAINQATVDTQEQERTEIGKELHDNVNQVLTTTKLYLDLALSNVELKDELIHKSNKNIMSVINEIRQLSRSLMDPTIGDLGLIDSIHDLIDNINLTRKLHVRLSADPKIEISLEKNHKLTIFRIIQEALNNAIRHAKATSVSIQFAGNKNAVKVTIQDDGIGFDPLSVKKGAGLKNIQNRIYLVSGTQTIESAPGKGCKITINFPITKNETN